VDQVLAGRGQHSTDTSSACKQGTNDRRWVCIITNHLFRTPFKQYCKVRPILLLKATGEVEICGLGGMQLLQLYDLVTQFACKVVEGVHHVLVLEPPYEA
jgi:hypothetical protein